MKVNILEQTSHPPNTTGLKTQVKRLWDGRGVWLLPAQDGGNDESIRVELLKAFNEQFMFIRTDVRLPPSWRTRT